MKKLTKTIQEFLKFSYSGNGKYYLIAHGSRHYNKTSFGKFFDKYSEYCVITENGNDAPRGGKIGEYVMVEFTQEFQEIAKKYFADEKAKEEMEQAAKDAKEAEIEKYVTMIQPILNESRVDTEKRLSQAIDMKINATIFHAAVSRIRLRSAYHSNK